MTSKHESNQQGAKLVQKDKKWHSDYICHAVVGLCDKVVGATGVDSVRSCEKFPPCLIKPVPAGSKTDPLLAKAEPINDGGSTSVIPCI